MKRCSWVDMRWERYIAYHDHRWGKPEHDDRQHFEMLILESLQAGLYWLIILNKQEAFEVAFDGFDPAVEEGYFQENEELLIAKTGIVRDRRTILAAIGNARVFLQIQQEFGSFDRYLWGLTQGQTLVNTTGVIPTHSELSDRISRDLKARGMTFVGTTIVYSYLQAVGVVNDHDPDCDFR